VDRQQPHNDGMQLAGECTYNVNYPVRWDFLRRTNTAHKSDGWSCLRTCIMQRALVERAMALSDYKRSVSLHWCPTRLRVCLYKADVVNGPEGVNVEAVG